MKSVEGEKIVVAERNMRNDMPFEKLPREIESVTDAKEGENENMVLILTVFRFNGSTVAFYKML